MPIKCEFDLVASESYIRDKRDGGKYLSIACHEKERSETIWLRVWGNAEGYYKEIKEGSIIRGKGTIRLDTWLSAASGERRFALGISAEKIDVLAAEAVKDEAKPKTPSSSEKVGLTADGTLPRFEEKAKPNASLYAGPAKKTKTTVREEDLNDEIPF